jgi:hypothetical protein
MRLTLDPLGWSTILGLVLAVGVASCGDDDATTGGDSDSGSGTTTGDPSDGGDTDSDDGDTGTGGTGGGSGSDTSDGGSASTGASTGTTGTATRTTGTTTGNTSGGLIIECTEGGDECDDSQVCHLSGCGDGTLGYCRPAAAQECAGIGGIECENGLVCVTHVCALDAEGYCMEPSLVPELCELQPTLWEVCA